MDQYRQGPYLQIYTNRALTNQLSVHVANNMNHCCANTNVLQHAFNVLTCLLMPVNTCPLTISEGSVQSLLEVTDMHANDKKTTADPITCEMK